MVPSLITFIPLLALSVNFTSAAHAGFHVQFPWMTGGLNARIRPEIARYRPFCGDILHNPEEFARRSRGFLSFSGHPGDLVTAMYTTHRVPKKRDDFPHLILRDVPIRPSGQLRVNVTIPFHTEVGEMGVMYFEARDPRTGNRQHLYSDAKMVHIETLPEYHPAVCAANNDTLIPIPDEYL